MDLGWRCHLRICQTTPTKKISPMHLSKEVKKFFGILVPSQVWISQRERRAPLFLIYVVLRKSLGSEKKMERGGSSLILSV